MSKKPDISGLTTKERKEYLKEYRLGEEKSAFRKSLWLKLIVAAVVVAVLGGVGYLIATSDREASLLGEAIEDQGRDHIDPGTSHPPYSSNPPTSGPHWGTPQTCDFYEKEVPDEAVIHSLEHGAIWVTYKNKDLVEQMRSLFEKESAKVLVSPRAANDSQIAAASWGRLLKLEQFDEKQILDFIKSNRGNAPEPLASCEGSDQTSP